MTDATSIHRQTRPRKEVTAAFKVRQKTHTAMKRHLHFRSVFLLCLAIVLVSFGFSGCSDDSERGGQNPASSSSSNPPPPSLGSEKIAQFMQAGMYPQAVALLQHQIYETPTNADAHFNLGVCLTAMNRLREAQESFDRAVRLNPEVGSKIGKELFAAASNLAPPPNYQTQSIMSLAVGYDPSLRPVVAKRYLDAARAVSDTSSLSQLAREAVAIDPGSALESASLLLEVAASNASSLGERNVASLIEQARQMASPKHQIVSAVYDIVERHSREGLHRSSLLFHKVLMEKSLVDSSRAQAVLTDAANALLENDAELFLVAVDQLTKIAPKIPEAGTPREKYLVAVYYWRTNQRARATEMFAALRDLPPQIDLSFISTPVKPGRYPVGQRQEGDFGWGKFEMTLESVTIAADATIELQIRVVNKTDHKQHFIFFGKQGAEKWQRYGGASAGTRAFHGADDEHFFVVDDFGVRSIATPPHFMGTPNREEFNSSNDAVVMAPRQEIAETLKFGKLSPSATAITFVSPRHNGHQWEIAFRDIQLKAVNFVKWPAG